MADQADFPDIYVNDSATGPLYDGSEADPYSSISDINWTTGDDNSIADYYAGAHSAPVTINFKRGEVWRDQTMSVRYALPSTSYPLVISSYGTGDLPMFLCSVDISGDGATFKWTPTANWTSSYKEYGLEAFAGGSPGIDEPNQVHFDWVRCGYADTETGDPLVIGALTDHAAVWGDPGFGFPTVVIRDESGDPDTTGISIEASTSHSSIVYVYDDNVIFEQIEVRGSGGHGVRIVGGNNNTTVRDCTLKHNWWAGYQIYSNSTNCKLQTCDISHCKGANVNINGGNTSRVTGLIIEYCDIHDADVNYGAFSEASGLKAFCLDDSFLRYNSWYNNASGAMRLDGLSGQYGCDDNEIYGNDIYNNGGIGYVAGADQGLYFQVELEYSSRNLIYLNYFHDPFGGGPNLGFSHSYTDDNYAFANILTGSYTNYWQCSMHFQTFSGTRGTNHAYNNLIYGAWKGLGHATTGDVEWKNNIVANCGYCAVNISVGPEYTDTLISDYNCFQVKDGRVARVLYDNYTLAGWRSLTLGRGNPLDVNSIDSDPLLTDPDNEDFSLQSGSPCIKTGESIGEPYNVGFLPGSALPPNIPTTGDRGDY